VPFFIIAGFLEGFVTRHYLEMGSLLRAAIILASFALIIWYFIIYPIKVERQLYE
jgi:hypothetical protein